jgi:hypothetical protein
VFLWLPRWRPWDTSPNHFARLDRKTGDRALRRASHLPLYYWQWLGSSSALTYYLQFAKGDLRLHLIGNALLLGLFVSLVMRGAECYGAIGTGAVWAIINGLNAAMLDSDRSCAGA